MTSDWTNDETLAFLEQYRKEPVIWNPTHSRHRDKRQHRDAWRRVSNELGRPVPDLKRKKDSLMATFRNLLRKKRLAIKSGLEADEIHEPIWFAYNLMESFLAPITKAHDNTNNEQNEESASSTGNGSHMTTPSVATTTTTVQVPTVRHHGNYVFKETGNQMMEALSMLNNVLMKMTAEKEDDECDLYTKMLAKKLRKLPEDDREVLMHEIDEIVFKRRLKRKSKSSYSSATEKVPIDKRVYAPISSEVPKKQIKIERADTDDYDTLTESLSEDSFASQNKLFKDILPEKMSLLDFC